LQEKKKCSFFQPDDAALSGAVPKRVCLQEYGVPFWETGEEATHQS
jgi:hypothetical protein